MASNQETRGSGGGRDPHSQLCLQEQSSTATTSLALADDTHPMFTLGLQVISTQYTPQRLCACCINDHTLLSAHHDEPHALDPTQSTEDDQHQASSSAISSRDTLSYPTPQNLLQPDRLTPSTPSSAPTPNTPVPSTAPNPNPRADPSLAPSLGCAHDPRVHSGCCWLIIGQSLPFAACRVGSWILGGPDMKYALERSVAAASEYWRSGGDCAAFTQVPGRLDRLGRRQEAPGSTVVDDEDGVEFDYDEAFL